MRPAGARLISPSSIQNFHSVAGTSTSAFGNAGVPSAVSRPFTWSVWKCEITTMSTALGSKPAAAMLSANSPLAPLLLTFATAPLPVSSTTSLPPVLITSGAK